MKRVAISVLAPLLALGACESAGMATYQVPAAKPGVLFGDQASLARQAGLLSQTTQYEYLCGTANLYSSLQILGSEQMARVLVLEASKEVQFLPCVRQGDVLSCEAGGLSAQLDTKTGTARFVEATTNTNISCSSKPA